MAAIPPIEVALLDATLDDVPEEPTRPLRELASAVRLANEHRDIGRYDLAGRELGALLAELQVAAVAGATEPERRQALEVLVEASFVAYGLTKAMGRTASAVQAAERGMDAARRLGDPALIGFAGWYRALALMRVGARRRAGTGLAEVIENLAGVDPTAENTLTAEVYGLAVLTRAVLAARDQDADAAHAHLEEADRVAAATGDRNGLPLCRAFQRGRGEPAHVG